METAGGGEGIGGGSRPYHTHNHSDAEGNTTAVLHWHRRGAPSSSLVSWVLPAIPSSPYARATLASRQ